MSELAEITPDSCPRGELFIAKSEHHMITEDRNGRYWVYRIGATISTRDSFRHFKRAYDAAFRDDEVLQVKKEVEGRVLARDIQRACCEYYGLPMLDLISHRRSKYMIVPRHMAMFLCRELTKKSHPEIGKLFDNRDHTSIMGAIESLTNKMESDKSITEDMTNIKKLLSAKVKHDVNKPKAGSHPQPR